MIMPRMRIRSAAPNFATICSAYSSGRGTTSDGAAEGRGSFGDAGMGVGDTSNRTEKRIVALDRWRKLYYDIRVSQHHTSPKISSLWLTGKYSRRPPKIKMGCFNPLKWKLRTFAYVSLLWVVMYILFAYKKAHHVNFEFVIRRSEPETVWNFVADFNNMKKLNPTIEDFDIVADSTGHDHWKYSVHYTEHLSHFPKIKNSAQAHYVVKSEEDGFLIKSEHRTCFFSTFGCLNSHSNFKFLNHGPDTKCVESIQFECPIIFSSFCHREVMFQRQEIMKNLKSHFAVINIRLEDDK